MRSISQTERITRDICTESRFLQIPHALVALADVPENAIGVHSCDHVMLSCVVSPLQEYVCNTGDGRLIPCLPHSLQACVWERGESIEARWSGIANFLVLNMTPEFLRTAWHEATDGAIPRIRGQVGLTDPFILHGLRAMHMEFTQPFGAVFQESLATSIAGRLIALSLNRTPQIGSLTRRELRIALEYVDAHLSGFSIYDLAAEFGRSPDYFRRLFQRATGLTPLQYLIRRRVEKAQQLLSESGLSVSQIATLCGFYDQPHLDRQFRSHFGVSPSDFRERFF